MGSRSLRQQVGNALFMLLVFLFVADPTNTIFGLKMVVFALLLGYNILFFRAEWAQLRYFLICSAAVIVPWLLSSLRGEIIDYGEVRAVFTAISPLLLLPWIYRYDLLRLSLVPVVAVVVIVLFLYWLIIFVPRVEGIVYLYMCEHDHTIMLSRRAFLGFSMFGMYCKSTVAFLPVFAMLLYRLCVPRMRNAVVVMCVLLFVHLFLISGTRSTIVLPVFLALLVLFVFYRNKRYVNYLFYPSALVLFFALFALLATLLMEVGEHSNMVKYAHLHSYKELFTDNPLYLLVGQGPGTAFYTAGFNKMSLKTEWSYMELLRNYGLFSIFILYTFLRPLASIMHSSCKNDEALVVAATYIVYLVIAGTNPLLLSSTGMLVLLTMFSYARQCKMKNGLKNNVCYENV